MTDAVAAPRRLAFWTAIGDLVQLVLRSRARGLKSRLGFALALVLLGKWTGVVAPLLVSRAIDTLGAGRSGQDQVFIAFAGLVTGWVGLRFIAGVAPYLREAIFTPVSQEALARSAAEAFAHTLELPLSFHQSKHTGGLARLIDRGARSTDYLIRSVVFNLGPTLLELIMAAAVLTAKFNWRLAAAAVATIVVYIAFTFSISNWRIRHRRQLNDADSSAAGLAVDAFMNFETIKAFGAEERMLERYQNAMAGYTQAAVKANTSLQLLNGVQSVVLNVGLVTVALLAGSEVLHHRMSLGGVTACILILQQVYAPLFSLGMNYREIRQSFIDMEQMIELMSEAPEIVETEHPRALPPARGGGSELTFDRVGFRHDARSIGLESVNFTAPPGTTTALVGPSGAGKTTMVRLALRLLDPDDGRVTLDGVDLRDARLEELRRAIALVPQDVALFNDTLRANIAFADPNAADDEVWRALEAAELAGFVKALPQGLETQVGERGLKLSGGERQRVGIARALLVHPRLLILDEATSALDGPTEAAIQATLRKVRAGRTTLVVAHRLSTIVDADQILVIEAGRIVERGRHEALLARNGLYAGLWRRQTRGDEASAATRQLAS